MFVRNFWRLAGLDAAKACSDAAHRAVRLGNPLVALSKLNKEDFSAIFDGNVRLRLQLYLSCISVPGGPDEEAL